MKISREFKIGIIALVAVALLIWGVNYLKGINVLQPTAKYYAVYGNVKGLLESAVVNLNGYKVGNVTHIEFDRNNMNRIIVEISLDRKIKLPKNTTMIVRSGSIISGAKDVDLDLGTGPGYYASGDTMSGRMQADISDYIDPIRKQVEELVSSVDTLMVSLDDLMDKRTRKNLQGILANLNQATLSLHRALEPNGSLSQTFGNLASVSDNLKKNNEQISNVLHNFSDISDSLKQGDLKSMINHIDASFSRIAVLLDKINQGEGSVGKLVVNDSLYTNLNQAVASLDSLLVDLKAHPGRYVHLSVFGKKD